MENNYKVNSFFCNNYYRIRNIINDNFNLCSVGLAMYSDMSRFANNDTHDLFFSLKKFSRVRKVGPNKAAKIFNDLIKIGLFRVAGKTKQGARIITMIDPSSIQSTPLIHTDEVPHPYRVPPSSIQSTIKTNTNTNKETEKFKIPIIEKSKYEPQTPLAKQWANYEIRDVYRRLGMFINE